MRTQTIERAIGEYVGRCVEYLRDLNDADRNSILDDIRQILSEVTAELEGAPDDLLGPPDLFVAELRAAAGLQQSAPRKRPNLTWRSGLHSISRLRGHPVAGWLSGVLRELHPAWWVGRGALVAGAIAETTSQDAWHWALGVIPVPAVFDSRLLGLLTLMLCVAGSVQLGHRANGWRRLAGAALTMAAALLFVAFVSTLRNSNSIVGDPMSDGYVTESTMAGSETPVLFGDAPEVPIDPTAASESVAIGTVSGEWAIAYNTEGAIRVYNTYLAAGIPPDSIWIERDGQPYYPGTEHAFAEAVDNRFGAGNRGG